MATKTRIIAALLSFAAIGTNFNPAAGAVASTSDDQIVNSDFSAQTSTCIGRRSTQNFSYNCERGEPMLIEVLGDGDTDLDLKVYDPYGRLVAQDVDSTDHCVVAFIAPVLGTYRIEVTNRGWVHNCFRLTVI